MLEALAYPLGLGIVGFSIYLCCLEEPSKSKTVKWAARILQALGFVLMSYVFFGLLCFATMWVRGVYLCARDGYCCSQDYPDAAPVFFKDWIRRK